MTVTCPNCHTTYNLADDKARPGAKLRCTVCRQVFVLPDPSAPSEEQEEVPASVAETERTENVSAAAGQDLSISIGSSSRKASRPKRRAPIILFVLLILLSGGGVLAWKYTPWLDAVKEKMGLSTSVVPEMTAAEQAAKLAALVSDLQLTEVRQYLVFNDKIGGNISVIEGKAMNGFDEPRDLIRLEVTLYDDADNPLVSKTQLAGSMVSLFQLQVLSEQELESALTNKLDILSNNTNVPPGGTVPFMVVFYQPPDTATNFTVQVIGARLPEARK